MDSNKRKPKQKAANRFLGLSKERLDELAEEAITDAYGDEEQVSGFYTMMENDLHLPFETEVLGAKVTVEGIDLTDDNDIVAVCRKGKTKQRIGIRELPLPSPAPEGAEWIAAYRHWRRFW
jgi:hypothetical protein